MLLVSSTYHRFVVCEAVCEDSAEAAVVPASFQCDLEDYSVEICLVAQDGWAEGRNAAQSVGDLHDPFRPSGTSEAVALLD